MAMDRKDRPIGSHFYATERYYEIRHVAELATLIFWHILQVLTNLLTAAFSPDAVNELATCL
jgi:hypothetical protein